MRNSIFHTRYLGRYAALITQTTAAKTLKKNYGTTPSGHKLDIYNPSLTMASSDREIRGS